MKLIYTLSLLLFSFVATAQNESYTSYFTGNTEDAVTEDIQAGLLLAGGAGDSDAAMTWFLNRSGGGDILVLRASGSDGYNEYLFSELGVSVNSVETIVFHNAEASTDEYVLQQIQNAEAVFIAGGDQYNYYLYWKDTPVEDALNALINEKGITIGGTSAGMAILGNCYYTPSGESATAEVVLANPFSADIDIIGRNDFLQVPYTENLITDTHFDQRERSGRHFTFMARIAAEYNVRSFGIAANEYTAVAIDENGLARAFGEYPDFDEDFVYFLQANCQDEYLPENLNEGEALTWNRNGIAVKAYRVPGNIDGEFTFDLNDWETGVGGTWQNWTAVEGGFTRTDTEISDCSTGLTSSVQNLEFTNINLSPNPTSDFLKLEIPEEIDLQSHLKIYNSKGQILREFKRVYEQIEVSDLPAGMYFLKINTEEKTYGGKFLKEN